MTDRAHVVGSLLRPAKLRGAREALCSGEIRLGELKRIEDRAVDEALALQQDAGIDVVTDGEMRRAHFADPLLEGCDGFARSPAPARTFRSQSGEATEHRAPVCVAERLQRRRFVATEEFSYARTQAARPVKVTLPSPLLLCMFWSPSRSAAAYDDPFDLFRDAAEQLRREIQELARLGCGIVQLDAPELATLVDDTQRAHWASIGIAPDRLLDEGIEIINSVTGCPGVDYALHLCRGNRHARWTSEGGYESIARQALARAHGFDTLLLEYDDERSGSFEPLRVVPEDKRVVLGLISTKRSAPESARAVAARVREAARHFPLAQLAVSTQCGFGGLTDTRMPLEAQRAKLELVREVADRVWG